LSFTTWVSRIFEKNVNNYEYVDDLKEMIHFIKDEEHSQISFC